MNLHEKNVLTIDIHTHIIPEKLPDWKQKFGYGEFVSLEHHKPCCARMMMDGEFFREIENNCWDAEQRLKECNHFHVDVQALSTIPVMFSYWADPKHTLEISQYLNDHIADICARYPKRFVGLGTLPMQHTDLAIQELKRCKDIGIKGIQIGSHVNEWNLNEPRLFPIFEAMQELDLSLFVHPWWYSAKKKMPNYWLPWLVGMPAETSLAISSMIFGGIFERLPNLRVAFAHGGGSFPATIGRIEHGWKARPDLVAIDNPKNPREYLGDFWLDSLVHDPKMLRYIADLVGIEKICLGTDYPFPLGEDIPGELIKNSGFTSQEQAIMLGDSALKWLKMNKNHFV
jgi:aminocarboxymuconate-semialdehyde decarboxylase